MNVSETEHNVTNINYDIPFVIAKNKEVFEVPTKLLLQPPTRKIIHVQKILKRTYTANFCNFNENQLESNTEDYSANTYTNNDLEDTVNLEEESLNEGNKELKKFIEDFKLTSLELLKHGKNLEEMYESLNNISIFNYRLSKNDMNKRYHETYKERN